VNFDIESMLYSLPAIVVGFTVHEFAHGIVAYWLGDDTAKNQGRLTLNPIKHIDPFGMLFILFAGFGWAKPVQFNPENLKNPDRDSILISIAGPISNLLLGLWAVVVLHILIFFVAGTDSVVLQTVAQLLYVFMYINFALFVFNLIPIPPLDGSHVVFRSLKLSREFEIKATQYGGTALFVILIADSYTDLHLLPIGWVLDKMVGVFF